MQLGMDMGIDIVEVLQVGLLILEIVRNHDGHEVDPGQNSTSWID